MFAALVGTLELLSPADRLRIAGFVVNKFRGDRSLLSPGLAALSARTGVPVLGVVPHFDERLVPPEDSLDLEYFTAATDATRRLDIAIVRLPRIANFDDFDALAGEPGVRVRLAREPTDLAGADLVIVSGSKNTWRPPAARRSRPRDRPGRRGAPDPGSLYGYQMLGMTWCTIPTTSSPRWTGRRIACLGAIFTHPRPLPRRATTRGSSPA
jgi:adenosylcobyric acid synthase